MASVLSKINSFVYQTGLDYRLNGNTFISYPGGYVPSNPITDFNGTVEAFTSSTYDLLITSNDSYWSIKNHQKTIVKYIDIGRFFEQFEVAKDSSGNYPDFIGKYEFSNENNSGYAVKFWDERWFNLISEKIDAAIAQGYDGFFLDDVSKTSDWALDNKLGNPSIPDAEIRMSFLIERIRKYIDSKADGKHLLLILNDPIYVIEKNPELTTYFDLAMQEAGLHSGTDKAGLIKTLEQYEKYGVSVLGHDWFAGKPDIKTLLDDIRIYTEFPDSIFSFNTGFQGPEILRNGPFIQTARELSNTISGFATGINLLSTGSTTNSILNGGVDAINYFIGSGKNCVATGGTKNDYFEMHQSNQYATGYIKILLSNSTTGVLPPPSITIKIDDQIVVKDKIINSVYGKNSELITIKIPSNSLQNILIFVDGASSKSQDYSCIQIEEVSVNGVSIDLTKSVFTNGGLNSLGVPYSYNGTMSVQKSSLIDALLSNTTYGNVTCIGGAGIDTADYSGISTENVTLKFDGQGKWVIESTLCKIDDVLTEIERLKFSNKSIAIDLNGNAGTTVKILGAVFGKEYVLNKSYVGIGLHFLDAGWTYDNLAGLALDAAGAKTNDQIVSLLWKNVIGSTPTASDKQPFIALLENGMTPGALAHLAADTSFNTTNINLVGLAQTGIEYIPVA